MRIAVAACLAAGSLPACAAEPDTQQAPSAPGWAEAQSAQCSAAIGIAEGRHGTARLTASPDGGARMTVRWPAGDLSR